LWTISGFRERDIAAGGKGAPLVPAVDYFLFRNRRIGRVALNIGGIANITVLPAGVTRDDVVAFDTGPGNLVIDALVSHHTHGRETYDRGGAIAQRGTVHARLLESMLADRYFALPPPKTSGREQFGQEFVSGLIATGLSIENLIATATELTAQTIARAIVAYPDIREVIASGGGVRNRHLMRRLRALLPRHELKTSAEFGIDPDAKEAIAFAVLAYEFVEGRPGNLPSATGARRAVLLGKGTPVS
jgi:anhydro-N-acetylmuramic acid kinase